MKYASILNVDIGVSDSLSVVIINQSGLLIDFLTTFLLFAIDLNSFDVRSIILILTTID